MFEPLVDKNKPFKRSIVVEDDRNKSKKVIKLKQRLSLNFNGCYIYGFNSEKTRNSLFYVHQYNEAQQKIGRKKMVSQKNQTTQKNNQI